MKRYDHSKIEKKWQSFWAKKKLFKSKESSKKKCYVLDMFPYPSGEGLHVGHPRGYIATDVYSRYKRMAGFNVLHPMGWDAFGLPAENYAIANKIHPEKAVKKNIKRFKEQLAKIGFDYDWSREINTTDPEYYKWTQWIFLQLFKEGLAYQSDEPINWCPSCKTGLANEDLEDGDCERCGSVVEKKPIRQWVLKITDYAERLLTDLDTLEWPEHIKELQRNWIGKSEGAEIKFKIISDDPHLTSPEGGGTSGYYTTDSETWRLLQDAAIDGRGGVMEEIEVFTTRPDTLFGATYLVVAPEHPLVSEFLNSNSEFLNKTEVEKYIKEVKNKSEIERTAEGKEKTGAELKGVKAINPANQKEIPIFVADYVLSHYGTGAIMAVPAYDERDFEFAKKFNLPIEQVVANGTAEEKNKIIELVNGKMKTTYKLRDWVFSRQRYWGEPIPIVHCDKCGAVPVPEKDLPVKLPKVKSYEPTGTGESPLSGLLKWVKTKCPVCKGPAHRETNTMPNWAGSSWYYLRYIDPKNKKVPVDKKKEKYWSPVDMYIGGTEHATRHLIYSRFWHKFLYDIEVVNYPEPFARMGKSLGLIIASDGRKMSKRWGNVINPDDIVDKFGADSLRVYEMFMGPFDQAIAWSTDGLVGARRFVEKAWRIGCKPVSKKEEDKKIKELLHKTIKKVSEDIEAFKFNTAVSSLMILANELDSVGSLDISTLKSFVLMLSPFAPHIAEEMWVGCGGKKSVCTTPWPKYDADLAEGEDSKIIVQVNGRVRDNFIVSRGSSREEIERLALSLNNVKKWLEGSKPRKVIYVPGKLINIVI